MFTKSKRGNKPFALRRSSTAGRSMSWGNRSASSVGGHDDDADENDEATVEPSNGEANGDEDDEDFKQKVKRRNSIGYLSEEELQKKKEIDAKVADYVSDQLERMKSNDSISAGQMKDEIEAQLDGN